MENIKPNSNIEDLKKLDKQFAGAGMGEGPADSPGGDISESDLDDMALTPQEAAAALIDYTNQELTDAGLTPLSKMQCLLLRISIIGTAKKYDIEKFELRSYPEFALAFSALWISVTKYREYQAKHAKKPAAVPSPEERMKMQEAVDKIHAERADHTNN